MVNRLKNFSIHLTLLFIFCSSAYAATDPSALLGRFLEQATPICQFEPGGVCVELGWQYADGDGDGFITLDEAKEVHGVVQNWASQNQDTLPPRTRASVLLGAFFWWNPQVLRLFLPVLTGIATAF